MWAIVVEMDAGRIREVAAIHSPQVRRDDSLITPRSARRGHPTVWIEVIPVELMMKSVEDGVRGLAGTAFRPDL